MSLNIWAAAPAIVAIVAGFLWVLRRSGHPTMRLVCIGLFAFYLAAVTSVVIFPIRVDAEYVEFMRREAVGRPMVNLVPFRDVFGSNLALGQAAANAVLGFPIGFALPFVTLRADRIALVWGLLTVASIELVQLGMNAVYGFGYRLVDINDLMLNAFGVVLGLLAFRAVAFLYRRAGPSKDEDRKSYLHQVMSVP